MTATLRGSIGGMDDLTRLHRASRVFLARINRYPVTDPAMRARALAQVEAAYQRERGREGRLDAPPVPPNKSTT